MRVAVGDPRIASTPDAEVALRGEIVQLVKVIINGFHADDVAKVNGVRTATTHSRAVHAGTLP